MKLAAIDIGSNSIHMIIVDTDGEHSFEIIDREKEMVFLGRSVFEHQRLTDEAFAAGLEAISKFHKLAQRHGVEEVRAVATSAAREAENGGEFLYAVAERIGIMPQVISGTEEARYIYLAVRNAVDLSNRSALVLDCGGGSVEAVVGDARQQRLGRSMKLGVQRLRTRFGEAALGKKERKEFDAHVRRLAGPSLAEARQATFELVVGTSGTILALGQAAQKLRGSEPSPNATGQEFTLDELTLLADRLNTLAPPERTTVLGVDAKRADTLHLGAALFCTLLDLAGKDRITLCEASLREGVVLDYLESARDDIRSWEVVRDIRRHSVLDLARRAGQTGPHPERVARLSLSIFDQTRKLHRFGEAERTLLEYAAILHDVGQHIGYERHEHHAAYIIRNGELRGFTDLDREVIALVARYHRKARPKRKDLDFAILPPRQRRIVRVLAGILRVADGLDRSHHQIVRDVRCEIRDRVLLINAQATGDSELEVWGARRKEKLLARALGVRINFEVEPVASLELRTA